MAAFRSAAAGTKWRSLPPNDENTYALEISGNSMEPAYRKGDIIIVSPAAPIRRGDRVVVKTKKGEVIVKQLTRRTAKQIELAIAQCRAPATAPWRRREVLWIARIVWAKSSERHPS